MRGAQRKIPSSFIPELHHILADENISTGLFDFFFSSLRIQDHSAHLKAQFIPQQKLKEAFPPQSFFFFPQCERGFSEEEEAFMKERQILARQLDYGDTRPGSRAGPPPRAGSRSPTHVEVQSCVSKDVRHGETGSAQSSYAESGFVRDVYGVWLNKYEVRGVALFKSRYSPLGWQLVYPFQRPQNKLSCTPGPCEIRVVIRGLLACGTESQSVSDDSSKKLWSWISKDQFPFEPPDRTGTENLRQGVREP
ncbi:hypothetical protein ABVT39_004816 [Epinephelus coioides]